MNVESPLLSDLKRRIAAIERRAPVEAAVRVATGHGDIDAALGGGIARGRLHEVFALDMGDAGSATGFVGMLAIRFGGGIVWLREEAAVRAGGHLHAPGLVEIGVDPGRLLLGMLPDPLAVLRAAADVVRCAGVGVAVIELHRDPRALDLTASRRLALAAEESGVAALLLRIAATPVASAADTRWAVRSCASQPLAANAPGHATFDLELLRQRGRRADGRWQVEWNRDQAVFTSPAPPPGLVVAVPARRPVAAPIPIRRAG
jgi:protein ImuA